MPLKNCYGLSVQNLTNQFKKLLPSWLADLMTDMMSCTNNGTRRTGLANFNALNVYALKKLVDDLYAKDRTNQPYDLSHVTAKGSRDLLIQAIDEFDKLKCDGKGTELDDLWNQYGGGSLPAFPPTLTDAQKGAIADDLANNDNFIRDQNGNGKNNGGSTTNAGKPTGGSNNSSSGSSTNGNGSNTNGSGGGGGSSGPGLGDMFPIDSGYNNGKDADGNPLDDIFPNNGSNGGSGSIGNIGTKAGGNISTGANILPNIPDDDLLNLTFDSSHYKCFVPDFDLNNYLFMSKTSVPLITQDKKDNIRKIHDSILLPIYNYYYGASAPPVCQIHIIFGLCDLKMTTSEVGGSSFSMHLRGMAVDFSLVGIDSNRLVSDIKSGALDINFGVLSLTNGIHITLPYTFEGHDVSKVVLSSPKNSSQSLEVEFL
jgi:predicted transcriptional regulator